MVLHTDTIISSSWLNHIAVKPLAEISIELSPLDCDLLLSRLPEESPLHVVLKNGVVVRKSHGHRMVQILCKAEHAKLLSCLAQKICPDAVSRIEKGIKFARTSNLKP